MRTSQFWPVLMLSLCAVAATASAQTPPKLDPIEEVDTPITVTTKPGNERQITEKREGGVVTQATVRSGPSTYTVKPNNPRGTALPGDATGVGNRGPQWTVLEFDLGKKKKQKEGEPVEDDVPPPPTQPQR